MSAITLGVPVRIDISEAPAGVTSLLDREFAEPRVNGLTRSQTIARIMGLNQSASSDFLTEFTIEELANYLEHLSSAALPRGRWTRRIMPHGERGVCWSTRRF